MRGSWQIGSTGDHVLIVDQSRIDCMLVVRRRLLWDDLTPAVYYCIVTECLLHIDWTANWPYTDLTVTI